MNYHKNYVPWQDHLKEGTNCNQQNGTEWLIKPQDL